MVDFLKEFNERIKKLKQESRPSRYIAPDCKKYNVIVSYNGDRKVVAFNLRLREAEELVSAQRRLSKLKGRTDRVFDIQYDKWEEL